MISLSLSIYLSLSLSVYIHIYVHTICIYIYIYNVSVCPIRELRNGEFRGVRTEPTLYFRGKNSPGQREAPNFLDPGFIITIIIIIIIVIIIIMWLLTLGFLPVPRKLSSQVPRSAREAADTVSHCKDETRTPNHICH